jgi:hypothetical protein
MAFRIIYSEKELDDIRQFLRDYKNIELYFEKHFPKENIRMIVFNTEYISVKARQVKENEKLDDNWAFEIPAGSKSSIIVSDFTKKTFKFHEFIDEGLNFYKNLLSYLGDTIKIKYNNEGDEVDF